MERPWPTRQYTRKAAKDIKGLSRADQKRVIKKIEALGEDPRPRDAKKLVNNPPFYRVRVGALRIKYRIDDACELVVIARVGQRGDFYDRK